MVSRIPRESGNQPERRKRRRGGDGKGARQWLEPDITRDVFDRSQNTGDGFVQRFTLSGEHQRSRASFEQWHAEPVFERLDLPAHCRLGEVKLGARLGKAEIAGGRLEAFDQVERWHIVGSVTHS